MSANKKMKSLVFLPGSLRFKVELKSLGEAKISWEDFEKSFDTLKAQKGKDPGAQEVKSYIKKTSQQERPEQDVAIDYSAEPFQKDLEYLRKLSRFDQLDLLNFEKVTKKMKTKYEEDLSRLPIISKEIDLLNKEVQNITSNKDLRDRKTLKLREKTAELKKIEQSIKNLKKEVRNINLNKDLRDQKRSELREKVAEFRKAEQSIENLKTEIENITSDKDLHDQKRLELREKIAEFRKTEQSIENLKTEIETNERMITKIKSNIFQEFNVKERTRKREAVEPSVLQRKVGEDFMSENKRFSHKRIIKEMNYSDYENEEREPDHEYDMARNQLKTAVRAAKKIYKHVKDGEGEMESWVQSKLTLAANYLSTVADYLCSDAEEDLEEPDRNMYENKNLDSFIGRAANEPRNNKAMATIDAYKRAAKEIAAKAAEKGMRDALAKDYMKLVTDINRLNDKSNFAQLNDIKSRLAQLADRVDF